MKKIGIIVVALISVIGLIISINIYSSKNLDPIVIIDDDIMIDKSVSYKTSSEFLNLVKTSTDAEQTETLEDQNTSENNVIYVEEKNIQPNNNATNNKTNTTKKEIEVQEKNNSTTKSNMEVVENSKQENENNIVTNEEPRKELVEEKVSEEVKPENKEIPEEVTLKSNTEVENNSKIEEETNNKVEKEEPKKEIVEEKIPEKKEASKEVTPKFNKFTKLESTEKTVILVDKSGSYCAQALDYFYEDSQYIYYFTCKKSGSMYVIKNGKEYKLVEALKTGVTTIKELEDNGYSFPKKIKNYAIK